MKVALVYDRVNKFGGAERVLGVLHELYPNAPLYTAVYNRETAPWGDDFDIRTTFLQQIPFAKTNHEYVAPVSPLAFEQLDVSAFDVVISITSEYAKGIITKPATLHICYCLTPTRYLWSGYKDYFPSETSRLLASPIVSYLRGWDKVASQRPDFYIAISKAVGERIKKYYERESVVVYPPVTLLPQKNSIRQNGGRNSKFFLLVSRLVSYKRIDIAVEACNKLNLKLKIIGTGREYERLKAMAGPSIEFLQNLTDEALSGYYQDCTALIYPAEEDFGLAILEAQSFGKPVIAYRGGGALETILEGKTGMFFYPQTSGALVTALREFDHSVFLATDCEMQAKKFGKERFKKQFMDVVKQMIETYKKEL